MTPSKQLPVYLSSSLLLLLLLLLAISAFPLNHPPTIRRIEVRAAAAAAARVVINGRHSGRSGSTGRSSSSSSSPTIIGRMSNDDEALDADNPFDAFGAERSDGGEDSGDSDADAVVLQQSSQPRYREAHNGVLAFHRGTEQALVLFVRQQLQESKLSNKSSSSDATSDANTASASLDHNDNNNNSRQEILSAVDKFCVERHWMMHVGPDKGLVLQDFLGEKVMLSLLSPASARRPFVVVELGTYCGYSTIRMADTMLRISGKKGNNNFDFHIFTVDVNPQSQAVAKQLVALAGLSDHVSFVLLPQLPSASYNSETTTALADELRSAMKKNGCDDDDDNFKIDFLFVDHAKELYLSDVQQLESSGFIRRGTAVAADNVVFFELEDYRQHMARLQAIGVVTTRLVSDGLFLEYVSSSKDAELRHANDPNLNGPPNPETELRDGLELTEYVTDPPQSEK